MNSTAFDWPILTRYEGEFRRRVALPLGGIGTGTVALGGRGDLRDWEIVNRPAKGFVPLRPGDGRTEAAPFFALWTRDANHAVTTRCLEGPLAPEDFEGAYGVANLPNAGLPRFQSNSFGAAYPLGQVFLEDPEVPLRARFRTHVPAPPASGP